jgi:hypothetical protein
MSLSTRELTLSDKQLAYCKRVAAGGITYTDAYMEIWGANRASSCSAASALMQKPAIQHTINALREAVDAERMFTKAKALAILGDIAQGNEAAVARISAIKTTAELQDWLSPTKVQVMHLHELLSTRMRPTVRPASGHHGPMKTLLTLRVTSEGYNRPNPHA